ncbi:hypothetical protein CFP65_6135 [Kitasatospora sp. MMS16-BH015]|uniref:hypothetical protein n=1 Tax=Kitasatospora sp. MMS16-BH015 TaxID=2018025 RepID=UPI000CA25C75|nr:hypothetical protein [Kitasatospora sp. MMS16-BH015]AUG80802.1 hypothetical protein CFP65_6135 [Kitasatospora sp. MMS16-BH015]
MGAARKAVVAVAASAVGLAAAIGFALPKASDWFSERHREQATYASGEAAKAARASVPRWLPDSATHVSYLMSTTGGDRLLRATLPGGKLPASCAKGVPAGQVNLKADWFPQDVLGRSTVRCGAYNVALVGEQLFAWQDDAVARMASAANG